MTVSTGPQDAPDTDPDLGPLSRDGFLGGRLQLLQPVRGYRAATDPVLLAAFTPARPGERVLDLGCGAGTASLCLAARVAGLDLHGIELQPAYARLARRNATDNCVALTVHDGDLTRPPAALKALVFDQVLTNPPFHAGGAVTPPADLGRDQAHREQVPLGDWIAAGLRRLRPGGHLTLIHRAERLAEDPCRPGRSGRRHRDPAGRSPRRPPRRPHPGPRAQGACGTPHPPQPVNRASRKFTQPGRERLYGNRGETLARCRRSGTRFYFGLINATQGCSARREG